MYIIYRTAPNFHHPKISSFPYLCGQSKFSWEKNCHMFITVQVVHVSSQLLCSVQLLMFHAVWHNWQLLAFSFVVYFSSSFPAVVMTSLTCSFAAFMVNKGTLKCRVWNGEGRSGFKMSSAGLKYCLIDILDFF